VRIAVYEYCLSFASSDRRATTVEWGALRCRPCCLARWLIVRVKWENQLSPENGISKTIGARADFTRRCRRVRPSHPASTSRALRDIFWLGFSYYNLTAAGH